MMHGKILGWCQQCKTCSHRQGILSCDLACQTAHCCFIVSSRSVRRTLMLFADGMTLTQKVADISEGSRLPIPPPTLPTLCPAWTSNRNTAGGYGAVLAYPAASLALACKPSPAMPYLCSEMLGVDAPFRISIQNFRSTNDVDAVTGDAIARLSLDVQLQDQAGQMMQMGAHTCTHLCCCN